MINAVMALLFMALTFAAPAFSASLAEARDAARLNNCPPKKIEIYQQTMGESGYTVYQIECNLPKLKDESAKGPDAVLIKCQGSICGLLRPMNLKK